jgi:hypothetical protein
LVADLGEALVTVRHDDGIQFRLTCTRHRALYRDALRARGITNEDEMERIRRRLVSLVMRTYPAGYLEHIAKQNCMGCAFEESGPGCWEWVVSAVDALALGKPTPPSVYKGWTETPGAAARDSKS